MAIPLSAPRQPCDRRQGIHAPPALGAPSCPCWVPLQGMPLLPTPGCGDRWQGHPLVLVLEPGLAVATAS